jgi:hypothetical protein
MNESTKTKVILTFDTVFRYGESVFVIIGNIIENLTDSNNENYELEKLKFF